MSSSTSSSNTKVIDKIWIVNGSIPSMRVLMAASCLGVEVRERVRLHVMRSPPETKSEEFLAINPRGETPTIKSGDLILSESFAILLFLVPNSAAIAPTHWQRVFESETLRVRRDFDLIVFVF